MQFSGFFTLTALLFLGTEVARATFFCNDHPKGKTGHGTGYCMVEYKSPSPMVHPTSYQVIKADDQGDGYYSCKGKLIDNFLFPTTRACCLTLPITPIPDVFDHDTINTLCYYR